jgi:peptidoglycan/LPS O-acetylase OafA/YrhL
MSFRYDINFLRAIALLGVLVFHFYPQYLSGGFAGVDIFFVISGYLMTRIIFNSLSASSFNLLNFYSSRANRIFPALIVLCVVLLVFGYLSLNAFDYKLLSKHVTSSLLFFSNFTYWIESGYFDTDSKGKWLLHTWSLSLEWQFYMVYPVVVVLLAKVCNHKLIKLLFLLSAIICFAFAAYATNQWPRSSFFLLPTRVWEMLLGSLAFLYTFKGSATYRTILYVLGLLLILCSYFLLDPSLSWPGIYALYPTIGAFLIIYSDKKADRVNTSLSFQSIGKCSYSIYLWHWPIVVYCTVFGIAKEYFAIGVAISLLFGWLSYKFVECRDWNVKYLTSTKVARNPLVGLALLSSLSYYMYDKGHLYSPSIDINNVEYYKSFLIEHDETVALYNNNTYFKRDVYLDGYTCSFDKKLSQEELLQCATQNFSNDSSNYIVIGDSHGRDFFHAFRMAFPHYQINMLHNSSCAPVEGIKSSGKPCFINFEEILNSLNQEPNLTGVIFASRYVDEPSFNDFINQVSGYLPDKNMIAVTSIGLINKNVTHYLFNYGVRDYYEIEQDLFNQTKNVNDKITALASDTIEVYDKYGVFCIEQDCQLILDGHVLFMDDQHLSRKGVEVLADDIKNSSVFKL